MKIDELANNVSIIINPAVKIFKSGNNVLKGWGIIHYSITI